MLASHMEGATEGAGSSRSEFPVDSPPPPCDVGFSFLRQRERRYENRAIWYNYILPSFAAHHLPHSLMKDFEVQFIVDK